MREEPAALARIRRFLWLILAGATVGMTIELFLIGHHEDANQFIPLALAAAALVVLGWTAIRPGVGVLRVLQFVMLCYIGAGIVGIVLHAQANAEFQWEMDPDISMLDLLLRVTEATAPPALAPALMVQLGLLGLVYTYKHPALREDTLDALPASDSIDPGART